MIGRQVKFVNTAVLTLINVIMIILIFNH